MGSPGSQSLGFAAPLGPSPLSLGHSSHTLMFKLNITARGGAVGHATAKVLQLCFGFGCLPPERLSRWCWKPRAQHARPQGRQVGVQSRVGARRRWRVAGAAVPAARQAAAPVPLVVLALLNARTTVLSMQAACWHRTGATAPTWARQLGDRALPHCAHTQYQREAGAGRWAGRLCLCWRAARCSMAALCCG